MTEAPPAAGLMSRSSSRWTVRSDAMCSNSSRSALYGQRTYTSPRDRPIPRRAAATNDPGHLDRYSRCRRFLGARPVDYFTGRSWLEQQQHDNVTKKTVTGSYTAADRAKDLEPATSRITSRRPDCPTRLRRDRRRVLVYIALEVRKGKPLDTVGLVGLWIVLSLSTGYSPIGLERLHSLGIQSADSVKIASFLGASAFIVALIAVNLPSSIQYLNATDRRDRPAHLRAADSALVPSSTYDAAPASRPSRRPPGRLSRPSQRPTGSTTKPAQPCSARRPRRPASTESAGQAPPTSPRRRAAGPARSRGKSRGR